MPPQDTDLPRAKPKATPTARAPEPSNVVPIHTPANGSIVVRGAREHNLKDVRLSLPRGKLVVFTGPSGSGKSSLAFDTIYAEGQRRYVESLSAYARQFLEQCPKPDVERIDGLSPAIAIEQRPLSKSPRSTVATVTEIADYLRLLLARVGRAALPETAASASRRRRCSRSSTACSRCRRARAPACSRPWSAPARASSARRSPNGRGRATAASRSTA